MILSEPANIPEQPDITPSVGDFGYKRRRRRAGSPAASIFVGNTPQFPIGDHCWGRYGPALLRWRQDDRVNDVNDTI